MVDTFDGVKTINLQPGERDVPLRMRVTIASASTANDGFIPFGSTLSSVAVTAHNGETRSSSTQLIAATSISGNTVVIYLDHTTKLEAGTYHIETRGTFSVSGSTKQLVRQMDFNRVIMKDR